MFGAHLKCKFLHSLKGVDKSLLVGIPYRCCVLQMWTDVDQVQLQECLSICRGMKLPVKNTHLLPSFFAYFVDLHRPVKGGGKPDSKVFIGVHPLHTSVFNVERCNGEG